MKPVEYMRRNLWSHTDPKTGEVNLTTLAEDTCDFLGCYDSQGDVPEYLFELAYDVVYPPKPGQAPQYQGETGEY